MDSLALTLLTLPIFQPMIESMGYSIIWFGVIIVMQGEMGVMTPPVGINVYVVQGVMKDVPLESIFKNVIPFLLAVMTAIAILIAFPQIALFLPGFMD